MTRAQGEDGFLMIEVLIGAVIVVLTTLAILDGLDGAQRTTAQNKARSVGATLAQDDQERLRSMRISDLSNRRETRMLTVAEVPYTVVSRAEWVRDSSGVISCSNDSSPGEYLRISSSASSPANRTAPVVEVGLVSPPPGSFGTSFGTTAIKVTDAAGTPLAGATVALSSSPALSDTTNALGCAVFGNLQAGTYTASVSSSDSVGVDGRSPTQVAAPVTASATTVTEILLGRAANVDVTFDTKVGAAAATPARSASATLGNSRLPTGTLEFFNPGADGTISADGLFPFDDGYGVYGGTCASNDPTQYDNAYFSTHPGHVIPDPGGQSQVTVRLPAINVLVKDTGGNALTNAAVHVTPADAGCAQTFPVQLTNAGRLPDPGHPFGSYRLCADDNAGRRARRVTVDNELPGGTAQVNMVIDRFGSCP